MNFDLFIQEEARLDIDDAFYWYEIKAEGLGERCVDKIYEYIEYIQENPYACEARHGEHRVAVVKTFPYIIIYRIDKKLVIATSVFATPQDPQKLRV